MKNAHTQIYDYLSRFLSPERLAKIEQLALASSNFVLPVVEDVYQYRNAGAVLRSLEANAFHELIAMEERFEFAPNVAVSKGADTWVKVHKMAPGAATLQAIKAQGYDLVAISPENNAMPLADFKPQKPVALIFGTEKAGVSPETLAMADVCVQIPMYGFTQSYNVSVAAGICFYHLRQHLQDQNIDFLLDDAQRMALKIRWASKAIPSVHLILKRFLAEQGLSMPSGIFAHDEMQGLG
jgi:tRNA (guanosine-2'-O-)-methyltransferase